MKKLDKWVPHELNANQKNRFEESSFLIPHNNDSSIRLWHGMKGGFSMATSDDQLSGWTKKKLQKEAPLSKANLHQKKVMVTVCWSAATLVYCSFLCQVKPLQLISMFSKLMRCTQNCKACSQHWSKVRAQFFSMTTPDSTSHKQHFKIWRTGLQSFASSAIFT